MPCPAHKRAAINQATMLARAASRLPQVAASATWPSLLGTLRLFSGTADGPKSPSARDDSATSSNAQPLPPPPPLSAHESGHWLDRYFPGLRIWLEVSEGIASHVIAKLCNPQLLELGVLCMRWLGQASSAQAPGNHVPQLVLPSRIRTGTGGSRGLCKPAASGCSRLICAKFAGSCCF